MTDRRVSDDLSRLLRTLGRACSEMADLREHELAKRARVEAENTRLHASIERLNNELEEARRQG